MSTPHHHTTLIELMSQKQYQAAVDSAQLIIKHDGEDEFALKIQGACFVYLNNYHRATKIFQKLYEMKPADISYAIAYSNSLAKLENFTKAIIILEQAKLNEPINSDLLRTLTRFYIEVLDFTKAEATILSAIDSQPKSSDNRLSYGTFLIKSDRMQEAKDQLKEALKLNNLNYLASYNLGLVNKKLGNLEEAKEDQLKVLSTNNNFSPAVRELASISELSGNLDDAIAFGRQAVDISPSDPEIQFQIAKLYYRTNKNELALEAFQKASNSENNVTISQVFINIIKSKAVPITGIEKTSLLQDGKYIFKLPHSPELIEHLYARHKIELNKTNDPSFGNSTGSTYTVFKDPNIAVVTFCQALEKKLEAVFGGNIHINDSFFTIFRAGGGTHLHDHITEFDKSFGSELTKRKFSLVYYLKVGDQTSDEPGILKLYEPTEDYLPEDNSCIIFAADRPHSSVYSGAEDRIIIGVNFYVA